MPLELRAGLVMVWGTTKGSKTYLDNDFEKDDTDEEKVVNWSFKEETSCSSAIWVLLKGAERLSTFWTRQDIA